MGRVLARVIGMAGMRRGLNWAAVAVVVAVGAAAAVGDTGSPRSLLADQYVLLALQSLGAGAEPRPDQLARAAILLDLALDLSPGDAELWRLRKELADRQGDSAGAAEALKRYCALRGADDAAQLELVLRAVSRHETLDRRVAAVEKVLDGQAAGQFSKALRSRLSSYAAAGEREMGNAERSAKLLQAALDLDRTNKDAVRQTLDLLILRGTDFEKIADATVHLVTADPLDAGARRRLAELLLSQGAYAAAAQQFSTAQLLAMERPDVRFAADWTLSLAASGKAEEALGLLSDLEGLGEVPQSGGDEQGEQGQSLRLPIDLELLRLAIYQRTGQAAKAEGCFRRLEAALDTRMKAGDGRAGADLEWLSLLFDQKVQVSIPASGGTVAGNSAGEPTTVERRWAGWRRLAGGDLEGARAELEALADDPFAVYGVARAMGDGSSPDRIERLQRVVALSPDSLAGLMAAIDLGGAGVTPKPSAEGARLAKVVGSWPARLASPNPWERPWVNLTLTVDPARYGYLEPIVARVALRNATDMPLGLGPGGSIPSRVIVYGTYRNPGKESGSMSPIVVDLGRRLRLLPRETVEVEVRLDYSEVGALLTMSPREMISLEATAVLDPLTLPAGAAPMVTGPMGTTAGVFLIERRGLPAVEGEVDRLISAATSSDATEQFPAVARLVLAASSVGPSSSAEAKATASKIADALNQAYGKLDAVGQAWVLRFVPPAGPRGSMFDPILQLASRSDEALVRVMHLSTQVRDPASAEMNAALRHADRRVVGFAEALRSGLEQAARGAKPATAADRPPTVK